mgnify:CR=1 FL=1
MCSYYFTMSSYRTYEEWKQPLKTLWTQGIVGSYRTYEEWKLYVNYLRIAEFHVLTVPMRNGNDLEVRVKGNMIEFLPYLWGMETRCSQRHTNCLL